MNKFFKLAILVLIIMNVNCIVNDLSDFRVNNTVLSDKYIIPANVNPDIIKQNTSNVFKSFFELISGIEKLMCTKICAFRAILRKELASRLKLGLTDDAKLRLNAILAKKLKGDKKLTSDAEEDLINGLKNELISTEILTKGLIKKLLTIQNPVVLQKSQQKLRKKLIQYLSERILNTDTKLSSRVNLELEQLKISEEIPNIEIFSKEVREKLLEISDIITKGPDNRAKIIRNMVISESLMELIMHLRPDLINGQNVVLVDLLCGQLAYDLLEDLFILPSSKQLSSKLSEVAEVSDVVEAEIMQELVIQLEGELSYQLSNSKKLNEILIEFQKKSNKDFIKAKNNLRSKKKKFKKALEKEFDINAMFKNNELQMIIDAIYKFKLLYIINYKSLYGSVYATDIKILDDLLKNQELCISLRSLNRILVSITDIYKLVLFPIDEEDIYNYVNNYLAKILNYAKKFINACPNLNIKLDSSIYSYHGQNNKAMIAKLEAMIKNKQDNFLNSFVANINAFNFEGLDELLSSYNKKDLDAFYNENKTDIDNYFLKNISCNAYFESKDHRVFRAYCANLMKTIAYLKHNSMELAIGELLKNKFLKSFKEEYESGITVYEPEDQYKYKSEANYVFTKLIIENGSMDEFLYFLTGYDYSIIAKSHFLSLNIGTISNLADVPFIMANPEYNPVNIALEAGNNKIANYFISYPESLYTADELIKLNHLYKNANATKEDILATKKDILSFDMKAVNFMNLFADSINNGNFDIAYNILYSFSDDLDNYSDLSGNTGNALRSIYNEALIQIINQDRRNNPQSSSIATISQTHNITKDPFDAIVNPLLESTLDYGASSDGKNILNEEREVLSNNDAYIFPNSIKTIGNPYTSRIMMLVEDIEDKLFN